MGNETSISTEPSVPSYRVPRDTSATHTPSITPEGNAGKPIQFKSRFVGVVWVFWKDNVDILPRKKQLEVAVTLYTEMFQRIPHARRLFLRNDLAQQALKYLDMLGWLIRRLKSEQGEGLGRSLANLGLRHRGWGVIPENFEPMLVSLHSALSMSFPQTYTLRVKFCMEKMFTSAAEIMTDADPSSVFPHRFSALETLHFMDSLDTCLASNVGRDYLERFLVQSQTPELIHFHVQYKRYRGALSDMERLALLNEIFPTFFDGRATMFIGAPMELLTSIRQKISRFVEGSGSGRRARTLSSDLLDGVHQFVKTDIQENIWPKFVATIRSIAQE